MIQLRHQQVQKNHLQQLLAPVMWVKRQIAKARCKSEYDFKFDSVLAKLRHSWTNLFLLKKIAPVLLSFITTVVFFNRHKVFDRFCQVQSAISRKIFACMVSDILLAGKVERMTSLGLQVCLCSPARLGSFQLCFNRKGTGPLVVCSARVVSATTELL